MRESCSSSEILEVMDWHVIYFLHGYLIHLHCLRMHLVRQENVGWGGVPHFKGEFSMKEPKRVSTHTKAATADPSSSLCGYSCRFGILG